MYAFRRFEKGIILQAIIGEEYQWDDIFPVAQNDTIRKIMYNPETYHLLIIYKSHVNKSSFTQSLSFHDLLRKLGE